MFKNPKHIAGVVLAVAALGGLFFYSKPNKDVGPEATKPEGEFSPAQTLGNEYELYTHPNPAFSLEYPKGFEATAYDEGDEAWTIVFQGEEGEGFQIFVSLYEGEEVTVEKVLEDLPGTIVEEPLVVVINPEVENSTRALIFWSEDTTIGRTREVWFLHEGRMYEVTARASFDEELVKIMSSWRFLE